MMDNLFLTTPHRRYHALRGDWVIVSPHRTQRPWQGQTEERAATDTPAYDPACYLCPGNVRAGGAQTPAYATTYTFENDYAALKPDSVDAIYNADSENLLWAEAERGICRVLCFSPRHDLTLGRMSVEEIRPVVDAWIAQTAELRAMPGIRYVQIFENRGGMMGASNPHPHGQIWATETIPDEPSVELRAQRQYFETKQSCLLCRYLELECKDQNRVVATNDSWVCVVPFWAVWPFETLILPRRHLSSIEDLSAQDRDLFAHMLHVVTAGYDRVFDASFPYSMGLHGAPTDNNPHPEWHFHAHFYPPLLRSATIRKFMVGFELLGSPQRDLTPELAAATLRRAFNG